MLSLKCLRCGYEWVPENNTPPATCANKSCRSPYWNKPRTRELVAKNKKKNSVHTSSQTPEWYTPDHIIQSILESFDGCIDLDPCTNSKISPNIPARKLFDKTDDGIKQPWFGKVFVNPPYGREIKAWVKKCCDEYALGSVSEIILLVPARVDTRWFAMVRDNQWCSISGRLKFKTVEGTDKNSAPFPSAVIYFGKERHKFRQVFSKLGKVYN